MHPTKEELLIEYLVHPIIIDDPDERYQFDIG